MDTRIADQFTTLKFALSVGQMEIIKIEERLKIKFENLTAKEKQKELLKNEAVYLYLKNFWQQYEFLIKKIEIEDNLKNFQFYIPLARILLESYGELLYLVNQSAKTQLGIFIGNYLLYFSDCYRFVAVGSIELKNEYERFLKLMAEVLSEEGIVFPSDINSFSYTSLSKNGFAFPQYDKIFNQSYFKSDSSDTFALWEKDNPSNFYNKYYRSHSNYTHPGFANQMSGATNNEIFWIIQFMYIIAELMMEFCNKKIFYNKFRSEYDQFTSNIAKTYPKMQEVWHTTRKS